MAKRIKSDKKISQVENWVHADLLIREIGDLEIQIEGAQEMATADINDIKAQLVKTTKPLQGRIKTITRDLEAFAVNNRQDFGVAKSRKLSFGILGWRFSSSVSISNDITLGLIKKVFSRSVRKSCIIVKESVDKNSLAKLTEEQLASVSAQRKSKDTFFVEPVKSEAVDYE